MLRVVLTLPSRLKVCTPGQETLSQTQPFVILVLVCTSKWTPLGSSDAGPSCLLPLQLPEKIPVR